MYLLPFHRKGKASLKVENKWNVSYQVEAERRAVFDSPLQASVCFTHCLPHGIWGELFPSLFLTSLDADTK